MLKIRKTAGEIRSGHKLSELLTRINDRFPIIVQKLVLCVAGKQSGGQPRAVILAQLCCSSITY